MIVDAHHHLWRYNPTEYAWIDEEMSAIRRDFLPFHLQEEVRNAGVDCVVSIQARQTIEETDSLLKFARENTFIAGVVGWLPLDSPQIEEGLKRYAAESKFRGVRHVLQGESDPAFMRRPDFNRGIANLKHLNLVYDILIYEHQLSQAIELVDRHPSQVFVLDHIAKPKINAGKLEPWRSNLRELARRSNVYCKISGMVTEADRSAATAAALQPYFDLALEAFGPARLMFGSDWPVCLVASTYRGWFHMVRQMAEKLSDAEREHLFGRTAIEAYRLEGH